jgi:plastocyanin
MAISLRTRQPLAMVRSVVLKAPGVVDYYRKFHPNMTGQISVSK